MVNTLYLPELREMLAEDNREALGEFCTALHPAHTAEFMEGLTAEETWQVLEHADLATRTEIFSYFEPAKQIEIIRVMPRGEIGQFIGHLAPDDRVDLLKQMEPEVVEALLPLVPAVERRDILRLRAYPEDTAGAVMTTRFARIEPGMTVRQALDEVARQAADLETIYYMFILDDSDHLLGVVSSRQLVSALRTPDLPIGDLMEREVVTVNAMDPREEVARKTAFFDLAAIPVVDEHRHMLGIITHDDVIDLVVDEATEDAHLMGGVVPGVENYLDARFVTIWRKRAVWLSFLFLAELFTFTALASFEGAIARILALSLFVPLCISTGGNSGSQAATLITRALALGQIDSRDWWRVLRHELLMGLALGCTLGAIGFLRAAATPQGVLGDVNRWDIAWVIAQAVAVICIWGTLTGSMLPLVFKRIGVDPGVASSPFVATFVDVTGIVIYFSIAEAYLL
jgi:magnesium transporter